MQRAEGFNVVLKTRQALVELLERVHDAFKRPFVSHGELRHFLSASVSHSCIFFLHKDHYLKHNRYGAPDEAGGLGMSLSESARHAGE
jgi:hypothetical protein